MAQFTCDSCGKCCSSFGAFIAIERQLNDRDYYCRYSLTGDLFPVHVDREYAGEVAERYETDTVPGVASDASVKKPCPFLCRARDGTGFTCAIYDHRPPVCREFRCYRMLVYDGGGNPVGKVVGAGAITTTDEALARLWKEKMAGLPHVHPPGSNDPAWVRKVCGILAAQGYRGDPVE